MARRSPPEAPHSIWGISPDGRRLRHRGGIARPARQSTPAPPAFPPTGRYADEYRPSPVPSLKTNPAPAHVG